MADLAGVAVYSAVLIVSLLAAGAASARARSARQLRGWLLVAVGFGLLAASRLLQLEDRVEHALRQQGQALGGYDDRAALQIPLVLLILGLAAVLGILAWRSAQRRRPSRSARPIYLALLALGGFLPLHAVRIISWHETDRLLYGGAIHLNWILDAGLSLLAAGSALYYLLQQREIAQPR